MWKKANQKAAQLRDPHRTFFLRPLLLFLFLARLLRPRSFHSTIRSADRLAAACLLLPPPSPPPLSCLPLLRRLFTALFSLPPCKTKALFRPPKRENSWSACALLGQRSRRCGCKHKHTSKQKSTLVFLTSSYPHRAMLFLCV